MPLYQIVVYVPDTHVEQVKTALFSAGAGRIGDYDCCAWQTLGQGQFRPLENSQPYLGKKGTIETVDEYRVELVCEDHCLAAAIQTMLNVHPYEEPAYSVWPLGAPGGENLNL